MSWGRPSAELTGSLLAVVGVAIIIAAWRLTPTSGLAVAFDTTSLVLAFLLGRVLTPVAKRGRRREAAVDAGFRFAVAGTVLGVPLTTAIYVLLGSAAAGAVGMNTVYAFGMALPLAFLLGAVPAFAAIWPLGTLWAVLLQLISRAD